MKHTRTAHATHTHPSTKRIEHIQSAMARVRALEVWVQRDKRPAMQAAYMMVQNPDNAAFIGGSTALGLYQRMRDEDLDGEAPPTLEPGDVDVFCLSGGSVNEGSPTEFLGKIFAIVARIRPEPTEFKVEWGPSKQWVRITFGDDPLSLQVSRLGYNGKKVAVGLFGCNTEAHQENWDVFARVVNKFDIDMLRLGISATPSSWTAGRAGLCTIGFIYGDDFAEEAALGKEPAIINVCANEREDTDRRKAKWEARGYTVNEEEGDIRRSTSHFS